MNYLRISVTDRCNLRCRYCMPKEGVSQFGHSEILSYEEILRLATLAVKRGINKIRITGGEPLVRKGVVYLLEKLSGLPGVNDLSMTTNAILLREFARDLRRAGLKRLNISMDSLDPGKYREITRGGDLNQVWEGIEAARREGMDPIKINVVAIISPLVPLAEGDNGHGGPARLFRFPGAAGQIGFISPMSDHFCRSCNRLRLTADGKLKTCLFSEELTDLKPLLRSGAGDEVLEKKLEEALLTKPLQHGPISGVMKRCHLPMVKIGG
ncbi:MAG: hypothetical protein AMJ94_10990 [Deltaproteobacteria bacterium SM23_61]|nr:MAG: hypothetical protein AMJ94_10990 [Deltaproteobacteria bacterium SM23_61]